MSERTSPEQDHGTSASSASSNSPARDAWETPRLTELPPLTHLTLATGPGIPGGIRIGANFAEDLDATNHLL